MLIPQRTRHDCAICTVAMALGKTYEEVMDVGLRGKWFDPEQGCRSEYAIIEAFGLKQMQDFRVMHRPECISPEFFLHFSWQRRAILAVPSLNKEGGWHSVYWTGSHLFDPCSQRTYADDWKALRPNEVILFNEAFGA